MVEVLELVLETGRGIIIVLLASDLHHGAKLAEEDEELPVRQLVFDSPRLALLEGVLEHVLIDLGLDLVFLPPVELVVDLMALLLVLQTCLGN